VKFARIEFGSEEQAAQALRALMLRGKVTVLRDHSFLVPEAVLEWLKQENIPFSLVQMLAHDHVVQTLRDHLADPV
jgi:hypothetical protein